MDGSTFDSVISWILRAFSLEYGSPQFIYGVLAVCGSITRFLWDCLRGVGIFKIRTLVVYILLGFFCGNLVLSFLPDNFKSTAGLMMLAGFVVRELLHTLQHHGTWLLMKTMKINPTEKPEKLDTATTMYDCGKKKSDNKKSDS